MLSMGPGRGSSNWTLSGAWIIAGPELALHLAVKIWGDLRIYGTSLVVQWLRLYAPNAGGAGSIPARGTRIPHACHN